MNTNDNKILSHSVWECKYPIVFASKYCRKSFYESHRKEIMNVIKELCQWKGVEIIEGEMICTPKVRQTFGGAYFYGKKRTNLQKILA